MAPISVKCRRYSTLNCSFSSFKFLCLFFSDKNHSLHFCVWTYLLIEMFIFCRFLPEALYEIFYNYYIYSPVSSLSLSYLSPPPPPPPPYHPPRHSFHFFNLQSKIYFCNPIDFFKQLRRHQLKSLFNNLSDRLCFPTIGYTVTANQKS